jgi:hypothetical protein
MLVGGASERVGQAVTTLSEAEGTSKVNKCGVGVV